VTLLLDMAIRTALLVLVGLTATAALRRQSAALRHAVLTLTMIGSVALPPLTVLVPTWQIPLPMPAAPHSEARPTTRAASRVGVAPRGTAPAGATAQGSRVLAGHEGAAPSAITLTTLAGVIWGVGFAGCAAQLLIGYARLLRTARRARPVLDGEWVRAARRVEGEYRLRRPVTLLQTDAPDMLATFGARRHRVLLPAHASAWSPDRIQAVLSHELAHVRRRDWLVQMGAEGLRCVYWFNPLMWVTCARLRCESEYACDDMVLGRGTEPGDYARHLMALARACRQPRRPVAFPALPMARLSTLERRITQMLNPAVNRNSVSRRAGVAAAALLAGLSLSVAAVRAGESGPLVAAAGEAGSRETSVSVPQVAATPAVPVLTSKARGREAASTSAPATPVRVAAQPVTRATPEAAVATEDQDGQSRPLVGAIYDASGGVMPGVQVTLRDAQQSTLSATTGVNGRFQFPPVAPGTYALSAGLPGFRTLKQNLELRADGDWDRVITLQLGQLMEKIVVSATRVTAAAKTPQAQPARVKVGGNVRPPSKIMDMKPMYPDAMREAGREAVVSLDAVIGTDGAVTSVRVVGADIHPDFAIAAADAVRQWKFNPTLLNGVAVEVQMTVTVEFTLSR
jgi:TonB family protein